MRIPSKRPDHTIEMAVARLCGGAKSAAKGSMTCGVTAAIPERNERASKALMDDVAARPIVREPAQTRSARISSRLRTMSPSGATRSRPAA